MAMTLSVEDLQAIAKERYLCAGTVWHVATTGSAGNDGLTWATPKLSPKTVIEAASAGDLVLLGRGTFALGNARISVPDYVSVFGCGIQKTIITSTAYLTSDPGNGVIFKPGSYAITQDLTVHGILTSGPMKGWQCPFGSNYPSGDSNVIGATLLRVEAIADSDGFYLDYAGGSMRIIDSIARTKFDAVTMHMIHNNAMSRIELENVLIEVIGPTETGSAYSRGLVCYQGKILARNCDIVVQDGGDYTLGVQAGYENTGTVILYNSRIRTAGSTGLVKDLRSQATVPDNIVIVGGDLDRSKIEGPVTDASLSADWADGGRLGERLAAKAEPGDEMALTSAERAALVAAVEGEIVDDETGEAVKAAIVAKIEENFPDLDDLTLAAIAEASAAATRDAILDRVLAGNHDTAGTPGKLLQTIAACVAGLDSIDAGNEETIPAAKMLKILLAFLLNAAGGHITPTTPWGYCDRSAEVYDPAKVIFTGPIPGAETRPRGTIA